MFKSLFMMSPSYAIMQISPDLQMHFFKPGGIRAIKGKGFGQYMDLALPLNMGPWVQLFDISGSLFLYQ